MKMRIVLKAVSVICVLVTVLAIACAITVTGSGFLDLSNIVRPVCVGIAVVCGIMAAVAWKYSEAKA